MGYYEPVDISITLGTLMEYSMLDKTLDNKEYILHHKENVDLIPFNLDLSSNLILLLMSSLIILQTVGILLLTVYSMIKVLYKDQSNHTF